MCTQNVLYAWDRHGWLSGLAGIIPRMGLNIVVGVTAEDWDEYADVREHFAVIGRLLGRAGAGQWAEPELDEKDARLSALK